MVLEDRKATAEHRSRTGFSFSQGSGIASRKRLWQVKMIDDTFLIAQRSGRSLAALETLIGQHEVVSFDIFDTLLCRSLWAASDVFKALESRHGPEGFAAARVKAEWLARRRHRIGKDGTEVTLVQIYDILDELMPEHAGSPDAELAMEGAVLKRDPAIFLLLESARRQGKRVIGVSDMYLPGEAITEILEREGIILDALYCSSDHREARLGKFNSRMYAHVVQAEGVEPSRILHFGDNHQADVVNANAMGLSGVHILARRDVVDSGQYAYAGQFANSLSASLVAGQVALRAPQADTAAPPLYTYGYSVGGALLLGFCLHILKRAREDRVTHLNLLARDGYIIEKALNILQPGDITYAVMPMSRRMAIFPTLAHEADLVQRYFFQELKGEAPAREFWNQLGLDPATLDGHAAAGTQMNAETFVDVFATELKDAAAREAEAMQHYLQDWIRVEGRPCALVDVGWGLSSFRALDTFIAPEYPAYFIGVSKNGYKRPGLSGYLFSYGQPEWVESALNPGLELIELLFSDTRPGFGRLVRDADGISRPLRQSRAQADALRNVAIDEVHRGALDFLRAISWGLEFFDDEDLATFNRNVFARLIHASTPAEYRALAGIPHARSAGHNEWHSIGHFWQQPQTIGDTPDHSQGFMDAEQTRLFRAYRDLVPADLRRLAQDDKLEGLVWWHEFCRRPHKVSRWTGIKRYQRRLKKRAKAARKEG